MNKSLIKMRETIITFLTKMGIFIYNKNGDTNLKTNIAIIAFDVVYVVFSVCNLLNANINWIVIVLNVCSYINLILQNYRAECGREGHGVGERYSLYFILALFEIFFAIILVITGAFFSIGSHFTSVETLVDIKPVLFIMLFIVFINKIINTIINLFKGK